MPLKRPHKLLTIISLAAVTVAGVPTLARAAPPQRIVSLNLCTDQLLLDIVPRERIRALSFLATDSSVSPVANEARGLPQVRGTAEEVLAHEPDLVLTVEGSTPATVSLLKRLGLNVAVIPLATTFEVIRDAIRLVAAATGEITRGEAIIARFDRQLAAARPESAARPTALAYQVNSLTSGPGGLVDAALEAAGFRNLARDLHLGAGGRLPLETLISQPPDLLVLANAPDDFKTVIADNLRHPAFTALVKRRPNVVLEMPLWLCGTTRIAEAVARLARARPSVAAGQTVR